MIGVKPVHLMEKEEAEHPVKPDALAIDIGARTRSPPWRAANRATARPSPRRSASSAACCTGKALDNRLGVAALIELALDPPAGIELWAAFTAQEEIGLRGAHVAAYALDPDLAIVLDATPAEDMPMWDGSENIAFNTKLGGGPAIYIADRGNDFRSAPGPNPGRGRQRRKASPANSASRAAAEPTPERFTGRARESRASQFRCRSAARTRPCPSRALTIGARWSRWSGRRLSIWQSLGFGKDDPPIGSGISLRMEPT